MAKIPGNIVGLPSPRSDWNQTNEAKADFIKNKPTNVSQFQNDAGYVKKSDFSAGKGIVMASSVSPEGTTYGPQINMATTTEIKALAHKYKPIVPANLITAVRVANSELGVADEAYVDNAVGEVETAIGDISVALDELHAYAQALIGGDA